MAVFRWIPTRLRLGIPLLVMACVALIAVPQPALAARRPDLH